MNTLFSIPVALIAALPAVCCMVQAQEKEFPSLTPEQKTLTADFHASLPELIEADELSDSVRGTGGFGSTGIGTK